jgi:GTP-dependent phosphoenolpyruvate carboxykinase
VREQLSQVEEFLGSLGERLPGEMRSQLEALKGRLG